jgi:hypothetical protein
MSTTTTWPLTIAVDDLPPSPNRRIAWQARRRILKPLVDAVVLQCRALGLPQPLQHAHVVTTLIHRRPPLRDWHNCVSSLKEIVDARVTAGLIVSDAPGHLTLEIVQVIGPRRGLTLEVRPLEVEP